MASTGLKKHIENYAILIPLLPALPFVYILDKFKQSFSEPKHFTINIAYFILSFLIPGTLVQTGISDTMFYSMFNSPYIGRIITGYIFATFFFAAIMPSDEN